MPSPRSSLRVVPERPPRALVLVRVSKERDGMVSPEIQETVTRDYCASHGYDVADVVEGIDESGSQARSAWWPTLDRAVAAVEDGEYDVLVVWKFSRAARHRLRWAVAIDRVESAGGRLESATEQLDVTTSAGRFARGVLGELNAFEAERIGEGWKEAHAQRVTTGRPHSGKPKWGYLYDREQKLHIPHPEQGPVLADLYRRYVGGESIYVLARWLNAHGWRTLDDGPWSDRTLRRVLDSGFAAGWFMAGGNAKKKIKATLHRGVHEPLIDEDLWQAYLDARARRRNLPPRVEASTYLLSGLVRCARCGGTMTAMFINPGMRLSHRAKGRAEGKRYSNGRPHLSYRCKTAKEKGPGFCPGTYIRAEALEEHVMGYLRELATEVEVGAVAKVAAQARRTAIEAEGERLAREAGRVHEAMVRLTLQDAERPVPPAVFRDSMAKLEERAAELDAALEGIRRDVRGADFDPAALARGALEAWDDELPVAGRREILRELIDCVLVRTANRGQSRLLWIVPTFGRTEGVRP